MADPTIADTLRAAVGGGAGYYAPNSTTRIDDEIDKASGGTPVVAKQAAPAADPAALAAQAQVDARLQAARAQQASGLLDGAYTGIPKEILASGSQRRPVALYPLSASSPVAALAQKEGLELTDVSLDKAPDEVMTPELRTALEAAKTGGGAMPMVKLLRLNKREADRWIPEFSKALAPPETQVPATQVQATPAQLPATSTIPVVP